MSKARANCPAEIRLSVSHPVAAEMLKSMKPAMRDILVSSAVLHLLKTPEGKDVFSPYLGTEILEKIEKSHTVAQLICLASGHSGKEQSVKQPDSLREDISPDLSFMGGMG